MYNVRHENLGYLYGFAGVAAFALTLPATRIAGRSQIGRAHV